MNKFEQNIGGIDAKTEAGNLTKKSWFRSLGLKLASALQSKKDNPREGMILPDAQVEISYGAHGTDEDLERVASLFSKADIYVPECYGWSPEELKFRQELSEGIITPENALKTLGRLSDTGEIIDPDGLTGSIFSELKLIFNSHKPFTFIDVPQGDALYEQRKLLQPYWWLEENLFIDQLEYTEKNLRAYAEFIKKREEYMVAHLKPAVENVLKNNPKLTKKDLKILVVLGDIHTGIYHTLKAAGQPSNALYENNSYGFMNEAVRAYLFDKNVDPELLARVWLQEMLYQKFKLKNIIKNTSKRDLFLRHVVSKFNYQEIQDLFNTIKGHTSDKTATAILQSKGLNKIPTSEEELDQFLGEKIAA